MKSYKIKQKLISINGTNFEVYNENGNIELYARQNAFTAIFDTFFGWLISIRCMTKIQTEDGNEECILIKKPGFIWEKYDVYYKDEIIAKIKREKNWWKPIFTVESIYGNFSFKGDNFAHQFYIIKDGIMCASIKKQRLKFADTYEVNILDTNSPVLYIAMTLAIDNSCFH